LVDLTRNLLRRDLRSRYKRSALGWGWSLINPLSQVLIFTLVFSVILKAQTPAGDPSGLEAFPLFLLCGLVPWNLAATAIASAPDTLVGNASLIKKVAFPREALVLAAVGAQLVTSLVEVAVLAVILLVAGNMVLPWLLVVAVLVVIEAVFVAGLCLSIAVMNVYLRDVKHFVAIALQLLFYASPIIYPISLVPRHSELLGISMATRLVYLVNPFALFVECYRAALYDLRFPGIGQLLGIVAWSATSIVIGRRIFRRFEPRLAEEL